MSESGGLGVGALQSGPGSNPWELRLEAAQAANADQRLAQLAGSANKASAAEKAAKSADPKEAAQLHKVSQDFESLFLAYMFKTMKNAGPQGEFLGKSQGEKIFTEMRDDELAKSMAKAGGIGLAKLLEEQLVRSLHKAKPAGNSEVIDL